eukprot:CAMPEP_0172019738 /NCGR_PEP_ID=MMETSP1041-20130122/12810_1 /TAXON_ID=464988 /ORGANISM="Hemiselmis andersenii, Strain CCMP439" /LENGTH=145 /DNA_ID=CAMNT_0012674959 /DNA_START=96 /DNA_END=533 /DNA_ORIENTATION=+
MALLLEPLLHDPSPDELGKQNSVCSPDDLCDVHHAVLPDFSRHVLRAAPVKQSLEELVECHLVGCRWLWNREPHHLFNPDLKPCPQAPLGLYQGQPLPPCDSQNVKLSPDQLVDGAVLARDDGLPESVPVEAQGGRETPHKGVYV